MARARGSRLLRIALAVALATGAGAAAAQNNLTLTLSPSTPPLSNAVTQNVASSVYFDVTNTRNNSTISQLTFTVPYAATGGAGPPGWALQTMFQWGAVMFVSFQVTTCGQGGLATGQTGTFRIDATPTSAIAGSIAADRTDTMSVDVFAAPCGGGTPWSAVNRAYPRKALSMTASAAPAAGPAPLTTTATFTVTNESTAVQSGISLAGSPALTVTPGAGVTFGCSPGTLPALAPGESAAFTCDVTLPTTGTAYTIAATARNGTGTATTSGAVTVPVLVAPATATFAFDKLFVRTGEVVRGTLAVTNQTSGPIDVTPPTYAQLALTPTLARAPGTVEPLPAAGLAPGATVEFVYVFVASGQVGASYSATGTAVTGAGNTNPATTAPGTLTAWSVSWAPLSIVKSRATPPYGFSVTVSNAATEAIERVDVVNPNAGWTDLRNVSVTNGGGASLGYSSGNGTGTLVYSAGTIPRNGTSTIAFSFADIPTETVTTPYTFQVIVRNGWGATQTFTFTVQNVSTTVPMPEVRDVGVLSTAAGQVLSWTNTSAPGQSHDGVVVFRAAAPAVPATPVDGTDYTGSPAALYFDKYGSPVSSITDPTPGAFNYRVCNHDAALVYSSCSGGFWNNAGWIDSAPAPAGGWTHSVGYQAILYPGLTPGGGIGFASNAPALHVLTAATGERPFEPAALAAVPAMGTPVVTLANGRQILFAADSAGVVTALDLQSGDVYWQVAKAGESFVAGVGGALRQYAGSGFQARYANDVLFLGSTSGNLLALDATTGATLWTAGAGSPIRALPLYDYARNWLYVPTFGAGVLAYDLDSAATPPAAGAGWANPGGSYSLGCARADAATQMTCVQRTGAIRVLDRATGAVVASGAFTGGGVPGSVWKHSGGLVVGSALAVQTFGVSGASITLTGTFAPGVTLSPVQAFQSPAPGHIYVGGSDLRIHKLRLDTAVEVGSVQLTSQLAGAVLGPAVYDVTRDLLVMGASDGRIWAVPAF